MKVDFRAIFDRLDEIKYYHTDYADAVRDTDADQFFRSKEEEGRVQYAMGKYYAGMDSEYAIIKILGLDCEQAGRLWAAHRALHRWYERTEWQLSAPDELIERLERFVLG